MEWEINMNANMKEIIVGVETHLQKSLDQQEPLLKFILLMGKYL